MSTINPVSAANPDTREIEKFPNGASLWSSVIPSVSQGSGDEVLVVIITRFGFGGLNFFGGC